MTKAMLACYLPIMAYQTPGLQESTEKFSTLGLDLRLRREGGELSTVDGILTSRPSCPGFKSGLQSFNSEKNSNGAMLIDSELLILWTVKSKKS